MFKVALIGASGLLGRAVAEELTRQLSWTVVQTAFRRAGPDRISLDIRDEDAVFAFFEVEKPDAVVLTAAERRPDVCENDPEFARALNVDAVRIIASAAEKYGAWTLSISTDYVFDGTSPPYHTDAAPSPINAYGRSKLDGERALAQASANSCVLRLPLLYGPTDDWSESAVTSLIPAILASVSAENADAVMDAWAIRYPTYTPDVAVVIRQMLERHRSGEAICGMAHWSADEPMTKFDIARVIAKAFGVSARLTPQYVPTDSTPRPHDCHLGSERL
ncbi:SDR family oxidoreductase, partial [Paraburkholderia sp.]|uniref:dTDP-4-dehydrorhamnose reductase family protein n=1 Tax=Paraburkholderia sp. TaxID=1926495 RepID=UPI0023A2B267